jgi:hypothetical protein
MQETCLAGACGWALDYVIRKNGAVELENTAVSAAVLKRKLTSSNNLGRTFRLRKATNKFLISRSALAPGCRKTPDAGAFRLIVNSYMY